MERLVSTIPVVSIGYRRVHHTVGFLVLVFLAVQFGCSDSLLEEPKWDSMIVMSPGAFTLTKGDSTFIGFGFWLDRGDGQGLDCAPTCIQRIEVFSPCWKSYAITATDLQDTYVWQGIWEGRSHIGSYRKYWHVEPVSSPCEGYYRWEVEFRSGGRDIADSIMVAKDYLTHFVHEPHDSCFYPPDSLVLEGTEVTFSALPDVPIGGWQISLLDSSGDPVLASDWMWVGTRFGAVELPVDWLEPSSWYSWKVRIWDRQRCNAWEMPSRRWFRTGAALAASR